MAADELLAAAMLGDCWAEGLQQLADAADAGGASLVRVQAGRPLAQLSSTGWAEAEAEAMAGGAPRSPLRFYPDRVYGNGFLVDHDVWTDEEMRRDAYYQEFLRPRGVFFHAKARLCSEAGERVSLTLKRRFRLGPYEPADIAALDCLLPDLHTAFRIARRVLDAEASGMARVLHDRGDPVFELDSWGRVLRVHGADDEHLGIVVRERRIVASDRLAQAALDGAVAVAVRTPQQPAVIAITNERGERRFLHVVPVTGLARDVFLATAAVVVVIEPGRPRLASLAGAIRQALGLTQREAQIAMLLAEGLSLPAIAERLHLGLGTLRNHLKSIFAKTGTRRQGELVALLRTLQL
jgi:DNA-binding CsgD family transcriptional regulator